MRRRNKRGLNRIGILAMAMLIALGAMGTAYGAWVEDLYINSTISIGDISAGLTCGTHYLEGNPTGADTDIDCTAVSPMTLAIDVTNAQLETDYYCNFTVSNAGSLPVKIATMNLSGTYDGVTAVFDDLTGTVIDPGGDPATGQVHIHLTSAASVEDDLAYTLAITVKRWNE